jgi:hypothetical protein
MYQRLTDISKAHGSRGPRDMETAATPGVAVLRGLLATFSIVDAILTGYLLVLTALLLRAEPSEVQAQCVRRSLVCIAVMVGGCVFARGATSVAPVIRRTVYRTVLVGMVLMNYLSLREVLPIIRSDTVDMALLRVDLLLFGVEPALWLERLNTRPIIEWFSFFYFSYFFICFIYMAVAVYVRRPGRATAEFAIGTALVYCLGQLGYMAVPGYGPIVALRDAYQGPLDGGFFWGCVSSTVQAGGAMKDIFPSLHTAAPLFFTLYAFHCARSDRRFLVPAVVTGFFSLNIIISTMVLRWHYAIDVVAGIALASGATFLAVRLARWEEGFRARLGEPAPWSFS